MIADNLKPEYYRIKGRPSPIGISAIPDIHCHRPYTPSAMSSGSSIEDVAATEEILRSSSLISSRNGSPMAVPNTSVSPGGGIGSCVNGFLRQPSSSGSLLGDLTGRPPFYISSLSLNVDPLLNFNGTASAGSSQVTSPVFNNTTSSCPTTLPPDLSNISDLSLPVPRTIAKKVANRTKKQRQPHSRQSNNNALPTSPSPPNDTPIDNVDSCKVSNKPIVCTNTSPEIAPEKSSHPVESSQPPTSESPVSVNAISPQPEEPIDNKADDDDCGFITVTNKKQKKRQQQQQIRNTGQRPQQPRKSYVQRDGTGTPPYISALMPSKQVASCPAITASKAPPVKFTPPTIRVVEVPIVPTKLSKQQPHLANFMLNSWISFAKSMEA